MAMRRRIPDIDDVPPPPYSETDIYSTAGRTAVSNNSSNSPRIPSDDAASRVSSHASSHSEVIYTPPLTPGTSGTQPHSHHNSLFNASTLNNAPPTAISDFAAVYFQSRPPPALPPREQLVHTITVKSSTTPYDVPYIPAWAARDVNQQDWATFINALIPHHAAARNEAVIIRKLQAEEEAIAVAAAASSGNSVSGQSTRNSSSHASAQLDQIRSDTETDLSAAVANGGFRREVAEDVIAQWNEGFFRPRSMTVQLAPEVEQLRMPGAWDQSFDRSIESPASAGTGGPMPFPAHAHQEPVPHHQPSGSRSWSFAGIRLSEDSISIGDRFVADANGIRMGNFVADERGIRFGSNCGNSNNAGTSRVQPYVGQPWHATLSPVPMFGAGPGPFPTGPHMPPPGPPPDHPLFPSHRGGGHGRGRGRPPRRNPSDRRSSSSSSSSSEASTDSDSSTSSIGSLPDYEDLYPAQLPVYKQRVTDWLSHPDQPISKADVVQLRSELRSARSAAREQARDPHAGSSSGTPPIDEKVLKAEIKALKQDWRKLKRQQRALRKDKRRERHAKRREEKRVRREQRRERREQRREHRESRREGRRAGGGRGHHHQSPTWGAPPPFPPPGVHVHVPPPPVIHTPPAPHITPPQRPFMHTPHAPPAPDVPPVPPVPNMSAPNNFNWGAPTVGRGSGGGFSGGHPWAGGFGRGWGSRGRPEPFQVGFQGAWPPGADRGFDPISPTTSSPHPPSSESLNMAIQDMEKDLAQKVEELDKVHLEQATEELDNPSGRGRGRCGGGRGWGLWTRAGSSSGEQTAQRLLEEIDEISKNVEKLRIEADAEYARELVAEDRKANGGWLRQNTSTGPAE